MLDQPFDLAMARRWACEIRVPVSVLRLLHAIALITLSMMDYNFSLSGHRNLAFSLLLVFAFTAALLLILDLDRPRSGAIVVEQSPLVRTLDSMQRTDTMKP